MSNTRKRGFSFPLGKHSQYFKRREGENLLFISLWLSRDFDSVNAGPQRLVLCDMGLDRMTGSSAHALGSVFQSLAARRDPRGQECQRDWLTHVLLWLVVFPRQEAARAFSTTLFQCLGGLRGGRRCPQTNRPASPSTSTPTEAASLAGTAQRVRIAPDELEGLGFKSHEKIHFQNNRNRQICLQLQWTKQTCAGSSLANQQGTHTWRDFCAP